MTDSSTDAADLGPGYSIRRLLTHAGREHLVRLLGAHVARLLDLTFSGHAPDEALKNAAAETVDFNTLMANQEERGKLLELLPRIKLTELCQRLDTAGAYDGPDGIQDVTWDAAMLAEAADFFALGDPAAPAEPAPGRETVVPSYGLFEHQLRAAKRVSDSLYGGARRVVLHLPTGVGKTRTAMHVVARHLNERGPCVVVWLASGQELLEQACESFRAAWRALGNRPLRLGRVWADHDSEVSSMTDGLVVVGLGKAWAARSRDIDWALELSGRVTLVVFDEAHQTVARTYRRIVEEFLAAPESSLLGLTATPGRTWADISSDEELAEFYGREKVTLEIQGQENPVSYLIDEGYLAKPTFTTLLATSGTELDDDDKRRLADALDLPDEILETVESHDHYNLTVLTSVLDLMEKGHRRILVFASTVSHANTLSAVLTAKGLQAPAVTATTPPGFRERAIRRFRSAAARPMVLTNFGVLTAGFDAPTASAAVIARPTKSLVLYSQMVGRVLRGPRAGGTERCEVITVVDPSLPGFGDIAQAFANWEDVWRHE